MPFLSVIVLSYNQEDLILTCLDSLLDSDVRDVQLIVADDASSDLTQNRVDTWLYKNACHFESTCFLKNERNLGTVRNLTRAVEKTLAPLIKDIAADDWFLPGGIDTIRAFVGRKENLSFDAVFTPIESNAFNEKEQILFKEILPATKISGFFDMDKEGQLSYIVLNNVLRSPGVFFTKDFWKRIKLQEVPVVLVEDWAMWMLGVVKSQRYILLDKTIVAYRQTLNSVSKNVCSPNYKRYLIDCERTMREIAIKQMSCLLFNIKIKLVCKYIVVYIVSRLPMCLIRMIKRYGLC